MIYKGDFMLKLLMLALISFPLVTSAQPYLPDQQNIGILGGVATGDVVFHSFATTSVTAGAYVQVATLVKRANWVELFESAGTPFYFATGSTGAQTDRFLIVVGGNEKAHIELPAASKIWIKAASMGAAPTGLMLMNFYGNP